MLKLEFVPLDRGCEGAADGRLTEGADVAGLLKLEPELRELPLE